MSLASPLGAVAPYRVSQLLPARVAASEATSDPMPVPMASNPPAGSSTHSRSAGLELTHPTTRSQHNIRNPNVYTDGTVRYAYLTMSGEPKSPEEDLSHDEWRTSMDEEYRALMKNNTWHLVSPSSTSNIIDWK
jgi:hypothetical protein